MQEKTEPKNFEELLHYISLLRTPPEFIDQINGVDYVKAEYMRYIVDKYFSPWNWEIRQEEIIKDSEGKPLFEKILGRLTYFDKYENKSFFCDMVAAHRIQYKRDSDKLADPGNDIKASNTDCFKKACNFKLHIADDVYKFGARISEADKLILLKAVDDGLMDTTKEIIENDIELVRINIHNIKKIIAGINFRRRKEVI